MPTRRGIFKSLVALIAAAPMLGKTSAAAAATDVRSLDDVTDLRTSLARINARCEFLRASGAVRPTPLPASIQARLPHSSTKFSFGFRDFLLSDANDLAVGAFLCSLYDDSWSGRTPSSTRFFCAMIARPGCSPMPFEYLAGAQFDEHVLRTSPTVSELQVIDRYWSDRGVADWLQKSMTALQKYVEDVADNSPPEWLMTARIG